MKLIVLNYHFPPDPSMGGRRWAGLGKYLARGGAEVDVVTSGTPEGTERPFSGVVVHRRARRRTLNDLYRDVAIRRRTAAEPSGEGPSAPGPVTRSGMLTVLRGELSALLAFPDYSRGWMLSALARTIGIVRERRPDVLVSSGPPHAAHLVGSVAARLHGLPHVVDFRDPWATHRYDLEIWRGIHARHIGRTLLPALERHVFRHAACVVANTLRLRDLLRSHYPGVRVEWVPNGVDLEEVDEANRAAAPFPRLGVAYTGALYGGRTLDAAMEAFGRFLALHADARDAGSRIRVAGPMDPTHRRQFESAVGRLGLEQSVEHLGVVPRERAVALARASSISLVLAQDQELQVPGKVYELAALGGAVLVIAEQESASADEAERLGLYRCEPNDPEAVLKVFERVWRATCSDAGSVRAQIGYDAVAERMQALLQQLGSVSVRTSKQ